MRRKGWAKGRGRDRFFLWRAAVLGMLAAALAGCTGAKSPADDRSRIRSEEETGAGTESLPGDRAERRPGPQAGKNSSPNRHVGSESVADGQPGQDFREGAEESSGEDLSLRLQTAAVLLLDSEDMLLHGERTRTLHPLRVRDGLLYAPVNGLAEYAGASLAEYDQMLYISSQGMVSVIAEPYNVALTGTTAEFLKGSVFREEGCYYVPVQDLTKLLHVPVYADSLQGVVVVKGLGDFEAADMARIKESLGLEESCWEVPGELKRLCEPQGLTVRQCLEALNEGRLYRTDETGQIGAWELLCDGSLRWDRIDLEHTYRPDRIYLAGRDSYRRYLYQAGDEKDPVSLIPELEREEELRKEAEERIEEQAGSQLLEVKGLTFEKVSGKTSRTMWEQLVSMAEPGDFLLFHNPLSAARYGYFNHSAMVLEKTERGLHLLQARGSEEGVGSDKDMDWLDYGQFQEEGYWKGNEVVLLCKADGVSPEAAGKVAEEAALFYRDYQFGYGSFRGLKETNCAELIADSYERAGISLLDKKGSRLRLLLEGQARSLVVLPDDLALSDGVRIKACWLAGE